MVLLGQIYQEMGDIKNANHWFIMGIETNQDSYGALFGAAYTEYFLGSFPIAEHHIIEAIQLDPNNWDGRHIYGSILLSQSRWIESRIQFQKAIELNPTFGWSYYGLGTSLIELGLLDEARNVVLKTPELLTDRNAVAGLLAAYANALQTQTNNTSEAIYFYEYALQYAPEDLGILKSLMTLYSLQNECSKVEEIYGRLVEAEKRLGINQSEVKPTCRGN